MSCSNGLRKAAAAARPRRRPNCHWTGIELGVSILAPRCSLLSVHPLLPGRAPGLQGNVATPRKSLASMFSREMVVA